MNPPLTATLAADAVSRREDGLRLASAGSDGESSGSHRRRPAGRRAREWAGAAVVLGGQAVIQTGTRLAGGRGAPVAASG